MIIWLIVLTLKFTIFKGLTNKKISNYLLWGGRLARPATKGGQDFGVSAQSFDKAQEPSNAAHPTSSSNLFVGNP